MPPLDSPAFLNNSAPYLEKLGTDLHVHVLPGIDDGSPDLETSLQLLHTMKELGYHRLIATPHIYQEFYPNTSAVILEKLDLVQQSAIREGIEIELLAAAEYFLDEYFEQRLLDDDLLSLPGGYVLVEMSFFAPYPSLRQILFDLQLKGFKPILAHPER